MKRKLPNWMETFLEYTDGLPSPMIFRKWAAIAALSGVMERKCWVFSMGGKLYPATYIVLVAPPGVGKSIVTSRVESLWGTLEEQWLASTSVTKASMIDDLREAVRTIVRPQDTPPTVTFNSLKIASNELGVLIPAYENDFMNTLTDIYDGHPYSESRRTTKVKFKLAAPQISLFAATTPSYLNNLLPEGAWDQGFLSRTMLVYSGERTLTPIFGGKEEDEKAFAALAEDLELIANLYGEFTFDPDAAKALEKWHMDGGPPAPSHPKLHHYLTRRTQHMLKLCMIASVAESNDLIITLEHFQEALSWLIEMEFYIPDIFKSMARGGDAKAMEDCWYFCHRLYVEKSRAPVRKMLVVQFLAERVPSHSVERIIQVMVMAEILKEIQVSKIGPCYQPLEFKQQQ